MRNRVAAAAGAPAAARNSEGGSQDSGPTGAGIPRPGLGLLPPGWHGAHGSIAPSAKHSLG